MDPSGLGFFLYFVFGTYIFGGFNDLMYVFGIRNSVLILGGSLYGSTGVLGCPAILQVLFDLSYAQHRAGGGPISGHLCSSDGGHRQPKNLPSHRALEPGRPDEEQQKGAAHRG